MRKIDLYIPSVLFLLGIMLLVSCTDENSTETEEVEIIEKGAIEKTIVVDNVNRSYIIYIPEIYDGSSAVPLIINYHGLGSNAFEQMAYGDFRPLAEEEGFIVAHPTGTTYLGFTHWNVGGFTLGSPTDDVRFTQALLEQIKQDYNIDTGRVYATGMSNGGFMSFKLACDMAQDFAAVASVTGSMTTDMIAACSPSSPMPVLQFHGTADATVSYNGIEPWNVAIPEVLSFWVEQNRTNSEAQVRRLIDFNPDDENFIDHFVYAGGNNGSVVEHYRINNGSHSWPGTSFGEANRDINATDLIWEFFKRFERSETNKILLQ